MREPQIRYAKTSDGVNIAYYAIGSGPPFVWPGSPMGSIAEHWRIPELRDLMEFIAGRSLLVNFDPRGFGLSDRGPMDYSCESMARDLEAVVQAGQLEPFTLQAFAWGTMPAIVYAARHPDKVMALILINGLMRGADASPGWNALVRTVGEDWEYGTRLLAQANDAGYALMTTLEQAREGLKRAASQEAVLAYFKAVESWDVTDEVPKVTAPTLVSHYGDRVPHYPLEASRRLAAALPDGRFASIVPAEGETVMEAATPVVLNFLGSVLPRGPRRAPTTSTAPSGTAVVLFADIVDSTALTERLGDAAFRDKARELDTTLRTVIREHTGTPIEGKLLGDGVLATFTSARQAIEGALACGRAGDDGGLPLHLGLHAGDVIREDDNVYGGAVNIAARISAVSAPGEVLVSETVRSLARTSAGVTFEDRGEQALKGVGEAVRVWAVRSRP